MNENHIEIYINEEDAGKRIDSLICEKLNDISRSRIQKLIDNNNITVNKKIIKTNYKVKVNDFIIVDIPAPVELDVLPEDIDIEILYEDNDVIVINKPQGMVVHPAAGNYTGTLVNALLMKCNNLSGINGVIRPGIVHRIDKDTSGVLVVAKNDNAHQILAQQIKAHTVTREYLAIVEGVIKENNGTIDKPIGRHPIERKMMSVVTKNGRNAITHFEVLSRFKENTYIKAILETGRTHQIRVHMSYIGHPLVGDPVYGYKKQKYNLKGQMLHAVKLGFIHPSTKEYMEFSAPVPAYFSNLLQILKNK